MIQLKQIKTPNLRYSERLLVSEHYAVSLTSRRAVIMNRQFDLLHEIKNLDYVYNGEISSDEKWLLLVSSGNLFYLYSLETFQLIQKQRLTGIYNFNLEGMGCFTFDVMNILIPITNSQTFTSVLRLYDLNDFSKYRDYHLNDQYLIHSIQPIPKHSKYLMEAFDRAHNQNTVIEFDGENHSVAQKNVQEISHNFNKKFKGSAITCKSSHHPFYYVGNGTELVIYNPASDEILYKKKLRFDIIEIQELRNDLISVVTLDKESLYEVIIE